jgi:hypothetical protein
MGIVERIVKIVVSRAKRAGLAIDFSTGCVCISHASDVLGECVVITPLVQRLNAEERNSPSLLQRGLIGGRLGVA